MKYLFFLLMIACGTWTGCREDNNALVSTVPEVTDIHSYARPWEIVTTHLSLEMYVDLAKKEINASAIHTIRNFGADTFVVDTKGLSISGVRVDDADTLIHTTFSPEDPILGKALKIPVTRNTKTVNIRYVANENAAALGWLTPEQTQGKTSPFLYTQGQAILTRTWIPLQDSPGIRFTYDATVHVPTGMMAAMSATNPTERSRDGIYHFEMDQPIPGYLVALAVGDFDFAPIGSRTGVYAEPVLLESAKNEFSDMEKMVEIAEGLYGPYQWGRYDLIILPPSFPFGGMENPRLTFATPTIIAGDKSLVSLVAHELAHSWSGNLVTNATWNDFWLNEGFTTYFENRIMEALYGDDDARMLALLNYNELLNAVVDIGEKSPDTHLFLDLKGRDPDDGVTDIAYDKGAFFLKRLEQAAGREKFDAFLNKYFDAHKFQSMTTAGFVEYLKDNLLIPEGLNVDVDAWVYGPGIPDDCPVIESDRFMKVEEVVQQFISGTAASKLETKSWSTQEWLHFIHKLPADLNGNALRTLDKAFNFTKSGNTEIAAAWYELALRNTSDSGKAFAQEIMENVKSFLTNIGRRRFLMPLYRAMKENGLQDEAMKIYRYARGNYHSVSRSSLDDLLLKKG